MKVSLFSDHDTNSSTVCYILYLFSVHPRAVSHERAELDHVFGTGPYQLSADQISQNPILFNKPPYITTTIKKAPRLFSSFASTTRRGEPFFI